MTIFFDKNQILKNPNLFYIILYILYILFILFLKKLITEKYYCFPMKYQCCFYWYLLVQY